MHNSPLKRRRVCWQTERDCAPPCCLTVTVKQWDVITSELFRQPSGGKEGASASNTSFFFFKGKSFVLFVFFFLLTFIDKLYFARWTLSKERCPICGNCNYKTALAYDSEDWYLYFHILAFVIQENLTKHTVRTTNSFVIAVCLFLSTFFINRW